ncbi:MAG: hypothetical protein ACLS9T_07750 [Streptococcus salivarius]
MTQQPEGDKDADSGRDLPRWLCGRSPRSRPTVKVVDPRTDAG